MGITISYRGSIADLGRVEDLEDRVIDLALEVGGRAQIWRSVCDHDRQRVVRGVILDLYPGQETTSLLFSPEGWLVNLTEIEAAENGELSEPPWCFVKTQFGSVEGHVALVELPTCLKKEFIPNLELNDEGGYYETRDVDALRKAFANVGAAIAGLSEGLRQFGMSSEAAEASEILASRIERVAELVHRILARLPENPLLGFDENPEINDEQDSDQSQWDELLREHRRKQERIERAIRNRLASGESPDGVFESALRDGQLVSEELPLHGDNTEFDDGEPSRKSLPEALRDNDDEDGPFGSELFNSAQDPLLQRGIELISAPAQTVHGLRKLLRALFGAAPRCERDHRRVDPIPGHTTLLWARILRSVHSPAQTGHAGSRLREGEPVCPACRRAFANNRVCRTPRHDRVA